HRSNQTDAIRSSTTLFAVREKACKRQLEGRAPEWLQGLFLLRASRSASHGRRQFSFSCSASRYNRPGDYSTDMKLSDDPHALRIAAVLILAGIVLFAPSFNDPFHFDDVLITN